MCSKIFTLSSDWEKYKFKLYFNKIGLYIVIFMVTTKRIVDRGIV